MATINEGSGPGDGLSPDFDASRRSRDLLCFIVDETLAGRGEALTQAAIATRVCGRRDDFDALVDPIVRIQAGRLRRSLERHYLLRGKADSLRIELPKGSCVPVFREMSAPLLCQHLVLASPPSASWSPRRTLYWTCMRLPHRPQTARPRNKAGPSRAGTTVQRHQQLAVDCFTDRKQESNRDWARHPCSSGDGNR